MDGVFLLSILVIRPFSYTPIDGGRTSGFGLPAVADPGRGLDVAIASSLVFEWELVDRGKLQGRLVSFSTRGPSSPELASFSPAELDEPTLIRFRDTDLALAPDVWYLDGCGTVAVLPVAYGTESLVCCASLEVARRPCNGMSNCDMARCPPRLMNSISTGNRVRRASKSFRLESRGQRIWR
jgi:hypothetical protein